MGQTYLDEQGNPIKGTGAYLKDNGEIAGPKPPTPSGAVNTKAIGGDTINGRDPNADQGIIDRVIESLKPLANPQSGLDLIGLGGLTSAPLATKLLPGSGPLVEKLGRGLERLGIATKGRKGLEAAAADILLRHAHPIEGAAIAAAPYAAEAGGKAIQAGGRFLQRTEPLVKFGGPVERTLAASAPAAAESAGPATAATTAARTLTAEERQAVDALVQQGHTESDVLAELDKLKAQASPKFTPAAVKLRMNAAETKEYLRLMKAGKSSEEAADLVKAQRDFVSGKGLQDTATVKAKVRDRNASGRWED